MLLKNYGGKVLLDKIDLSNNFGQLGIKDLTGHLNIGTTYSADSDQVDEEVKDLFSVKLKEKRLMNIQLRQR